MKQIKKEGHFGLEDKWRIIISASKKGKEMWLYVMKNVEYRKRIQVICDQNRTKNKKINDRETSAEFA